MVKKRRTFILEKNDFEEIAVDRIRNMVDFRIKNCKNAIKTLVEADPIEFAEELNNYKVRLQELQNMRKAFFGAEVPEEYAYRDVKEN